MKNKAFTLIELLAVIVILAIIALIATPAVLNIIEDSRKGAAEASARNIINAAKTYSMQQTMNGSSVSSIDLSEGTLKYDGDQATKGVITFENGKASGKMYVGGYCVEVKVDGKVTSEKKTEDECEIIISDEEEIPALSFPLANGTPVYFNPTTGLKCSSKNAVSTFGTKSGCMKFYAFLDSEENDTIKLLLDHNTSIIEYYDSVYYILDGGTNDLSEIVSDTDGWKQVVDGVETELTARAITDAELKSITSATASYYNYYLHTGNSTVYEGNAGTNTYAWLFDNLNGCTAYGCNVETNETNNTNYFTADTTEDAETSNLGVAVNYKGYVSEYYLYNFFSGVRPVIEVSKSIFE